jgi:ketosteroid isomerase-like protein
MRLLVPSTAIDHEGLLMAASDRELPALFQERSEAMGARSVERVMALYAPDVVYFDLVPPLRYSGADALRARFLDWFSRWQGPIGQEIHELNVAADEQVAAAHMLIRASGTLRDGPTVDYFVRVSNVCRRSDRRWSIIHEHVSLPVDLASGARAVMDLAP